MKKLIFLFLITYQIGFAYSSESKFMFNLSNNYYTQIKNIKQPFLKNAVIKRLKSYLKLRRDLKSESTYKQLFRVNSFFNKFRYIDDEILYHQNDYWANIQEFIFNGKGDCEDYAIAKYITLIDLGVKKEDLTLVYARYKNKPHMVLLYKNSLVLDNNNRLILPKEKHTHLKLFHSVKSLDSKERL